MKTEEVKLFEKTPVVAAGIRNILNKNLLFQHLDDSQMTTVISAFTPMEFTKDQDIVTQGEDGKHFFLLATGEADVYVTKRACFTLRLCCSFVVVVGSLTYGKCLVRSHLFFFFFLSTGGSSSEPKKVLRYTNGSGAAFGELALMYNAPRAATVRAVTDVQVWALDQSVFRAIVVGSAAKRMDQQIEFLRKVKVLDQLSEPERRELASALTRTSYNTGQVIVRQGDRGDDFYIVEDGAFFFFEYILPFLFSLVLHFFTKKKKISMCSYIAFSFFFSPTSSTGELVCTAQKTPDEAPAELLRLNAGDYFGEIALLTNRPRQATVTVSFFWLFFCNKKNWRCDDPDFFLTTFFSSFFLSRLLSTRL
jgi:cAMP-dependent protein kinase regulator